MNDNPNESQDGVSDTPQQKKNPFTCLLQVLAAICALALLVALFLPAVRTAREPARRTHCRNNLKQIGIALYNYHDIYHAFPPAYTVDAEGKPLHSWRTLILPFLDVQLSDEQLYEKIDLSKPWNDPANSEAYATFLHVFHCPSANLPPNYTVYMAVVAPNSCIRPTEPRPLSEITDDHGETLMVIEVAQELAVHWMAPQDADERIVMGFVSATEQPHTGGEFALFVDGSVSFLDTDTSFAERRALITVAGSD